MSLNPQNQQPNNFIFGSLTQETLDGQRNTDPQAAQFDIYWSPSPEGNAPRLPLNHSAPGAPHQSSPSSCSVTPTLGQFHNPHAQEATGLQLHPPAVSEAHPFPPIEPLAAYRQIQPRLDGAHNPVHFAAAPFRGHNLQPGYLPPGAIAAQSQAKVHDYPATAGRHSQDLEGVQPNNGLRYMHGPLQAERYEQRAERDRKQEIAKEAKRIILEQRAAAKEAKEVAAQEEKERKMAERAVKEAEKVAKQAAAKEEKERKAAAKEAAREAAAVERAAKAERAREAKEAKEAAKEAAKGKGKSKDGRRPAGDSDDEIKAAGDSIASADIKPIAIKAANKKWTDEECIAAAKYIASKWASFKLKQSIVFKTVSKEVLHGSKTDVQVANWWATQWKKFKACLRREVHTGGGDGDDLDKDANQEEEDDEDVLDDSDSELEVLDDG